MFSEGYAGIKVKIVDYNENIAKHAWDCYKMTWSHLQDVEYDPKNPEVQKAIDNIKKFRALPMPREQALVTFRIENISRVCMAQITRQRRACFNVESQMPLPVDHDVMVPKNIAKDYRDEVEDLVERSQKLYDKMIEDGIPPQDARYLLFQGQTTSLVYVVDVNTFTSAFGFRCENNLSDEINLVYRLCKREILKKVKEDYEAGKIDELVYGFYTDIITPADCFGAHQKVGKNYDEVFGNSFKRYEDADEEVTEITKNCPYDYKKSAWFLEMQELDDDLLFDGEKEMVDSWKKL